jgi:hypothetical protein
MKLAKALKRKNQLAGEVAALKDLLAKQNVRSTKQKYDYDNRKVLADLEAKVDELVRVKTGIAQTNLEVYEQIFRLAEVKGLIASLKALETKNGVFHESGRYGEPAYEVEYVAQLGKVAVDEIVSGLEKSVQELQDKLDEFNFTHSVNL